MEEIQENPRSNRNLIIGIFILIILVGGFFFWQFGRNSNGNNPNLISIAEILNSNKSMKCQFDKSDGVAIVKGTVFISEDRVRGDFDIQSSTPGSQFQSHFITRDGLTYTWTSIAKAGFKSPTVQSAAPDTSPAAQADIVGLKDKVAYACVPWTEEKGTFSIPQDISFSDIPS